MTGGAFDRARPRVRGPLLLFVLCVAVYLGNGRGIGALDTAGARWLPFSLLTTARLELDPLAAHLPTVPGQTYWYEQRSGHFLSIYPVVPPVLVTPLFAPAVMYALTDADPPARFVALAPYYEKFAAAVIAALSVVLVLLLLQRFAQPPTARVLTVAYAFATGTWVISSQALWQHGPSELLLAGTLLALVRGTKTSLALAGVLCGLLTMNRPPNAIFGAAATVFVLAHHRRDLPRFMICAIVAAAPFVAYNVTSFQSVVGGYYIGVAPGLYASPLSWAFWSGVAGLLVSPGKGLLVSAPFFLFLPASIGAPSALELRRLLRVFLPAGAVLIAFYGSFAVWWGGSCYGPRYLTDLLPVLILALVPAVDRLRRPASRRVFAGLVVWGVIVQVLGAFCYQPGRSDSTMDVWKLRDAQFLLEPRRELEAAGWLSIPVQVRE